MKAAAFDTTFTNALLLPGVAVGGAYGGADFNPCDKSDNEIQVGYLAVTLLIALLCYQAVLTLVICFPQRFCQSYMTELSKYIGADVDLPGTGVGVSEMEVGFLYGQYRRVNAHCGQVS